ncbi:hypothetical protein CSOJ01_13369 [Colletotrichum sojae]|uniref:Uncharacterized protein n=1 Tax=Colletotrichum sojae TaxID=2175907 RepID=A0A8H6IT93_9PEZI|nr:hypothetical protein CSOJ01_13369 [Colletotrichum sojae]
MNRLEGIRHGLFEFSGHTITDAVYTELCDAFPHFTGVLERLRAEGDTSHLPEPYRFGPYGKATSIYREFYEAALEAIFFRCPGGAETMDRYWAAHKTRRWGDHPPPHVVCRNINPALAIQCSARDWCILSDDDLAGRAVWMGDVPDLAADIFQRVVQRDAVWQSAWEEYLKRREGFREGLPSWPVRRSDIAKAERYRGFLYDDFPQALRDMVAGSSVVRCTFDIGGEEWNLGEISKAQRDWTPPQWDKGWFTHDPPAWEMVEPLPSWRTLMEETVFPGRLRARTSPRDDSLPPAVRQLLGLD